QHAQELVVSDVLELAVLPAGLISQAGQRRARGGLIQAPALAEPPPRAGHRTWQRLLRLLLGILAGFPFLRMSLVIGRPERAVPLPLLIIEPVRGHGQHGLAALTRTRNRLGHHAPSPSEEMIFEHYIISLTNFSIVSPFLRKNGHGQRICH